MCDKRLPSGVVLPEMGHDWATLSMEQIYIGMWVIVKVGNRVHQYLQRLRSVGIQEVLGQIIAADNKSSSVLILVQEHETA